MHFKPNDVVENTFPKGSLVCRVLECIPRDDNYEQYLLADIRYCVDGATKESLIAGGWTHVAPVGNLTRHYEDSCCSCKAKGYKPLAGI